jgi:hypothetical protein
MLPPLVAIVIMRPSWPEFFLLVLPFIAAILVALFAFGAANFLGLAVIGLLIALCTISIEADARNLISGVGTGGLFDRLLRARERESHSERASRHSALKARSRELRLARLIGAEFVILSLIAWFVMV